MSCAQHIISSNTCHLLELFHYHCWNTLYLKQKSQLKWGMTNIGLVCTVLDGY